MFLDEMAKVFKDLGCRAAYNLDGGHCSYDTEGSGGESSLYEFYRAHFGDSDGIVFICDYSWNYEKICIFKAKNETKSPDIVFFR